ncbi:hypothetical protein GCM10007907_17670 [Chitinimonas prasina]|uniref:Uncharacterized protein n=1 Tax=Chitinimonas prasina TaxID=1434937 RepID=A0ABQ5YDD8_9NEIS|nr:hypothetical protein [Chitinimonas prasina]GLR12977.1 hypothetical protein GCM10007907_17670 [Chitinimonas prasina]
MKLNLDWAAPVVPGRTMMGLGLGMGENEVWSLLEEGRVGSKDGDGKFQVKFTNSPLLLVEPAIGGAVLRDVNSNNPNTHEFDEVFSMGFKDGLLMHLVASLTYGASLCHYKGKMWNDIELGSPVALILKYCEVEFDSGDELFYPVNAEFFGFSIGGASSSLEEDPSQTVSYMRIYAIGDLMQETKSDGC